MSVVRLHNQGGSAVTGLCCNSRSHLIKNTKCSTNSTSSVCARLNLIFYAKNRNPFSWTHVVWHSFPTKFCHVSHVGIRFQPCMQGYLVSRDFLEPQKTSPTLSPSDHHHHSLNRPFKMWIIQDAISILQARLSPSEEFEEWQAWTTASDNLVCPTLSLIPLFSSSDESNYRKSFLISHRIRLRGAECYPWLLESCWFEPPQPPSKFKPEEGEKVSNSFLDLTRVIAYLNSS